MSTPVARGHRLTTERPGIELRRLTAADAATYRAVVRRNAAHLGHGGDWHDELEATIGDIERRFADGPDADRTFGIIEDGALIGQVTLVHVAPPRWGLGYWLAVDATGRGVMTVSIRAVLAHAHDALGTTEVLAGVSHGNDASIAVLERLDFVPVARLAAYTRFLRVLA